MPAANHSSFLQYLIQYLVPNINLSFPPLHNNLWHSFCLPTGQDTARNRLSKFVYTEGNSYATRTSEEVLLTSAKKFNSIHSAGFTGFKPSAYGQVMIPFCRFASSLRLPLPLPLPLPTQYVLTTKTQYVLPTYLALGMTTYRYVVLGSLFPTKLTPSRSYFVLFGRF